MQTPGGETISYHYALDGGLTRGTQITPTANPMISKTVSRPSDPGNPASTQEPETWLYSTSNSTLSNQTCNLAAPCTKITDPAQGVTEFDFVDPGATGDIARGRVLKVIFPDSSTE